MASGGSEQVLFVGVGHVDMSIRVNKEQSTHQATKRATLCVGVCVCVFLCVWVCGLLEPKEAYLSIPKIYKNY